MQAPSDTVIICKANGSYRLEPAGPFSSDSEFRARVLYMMLLHQTPKLREMLDSACASTAKILEGADMCNCKISYRGDTPEPEPVS